MLKFSEILEFSKEKFRKIPILKEFEWFEWFGPSPIEPFNSASRRGPRPSSSARGGRRPSRRPSSCGGRRPCRRPSYVGTNFDDVDA